MCRDCSERWLAIAEVISWLEHSVGLPQYVELFEMHEVDGALLSYLDKVALEELGVPSALHRLKLLTSLAQLPAVQQCLAEMSAASDAPAVPSGATTEDVRRSTLGLMDRSGNSAHDAMTEQSRRDTLHGQVYPEGAAAGQWSGLPPSSPWGTPMPEPERGWVTASPSLVMASAPVLGNASPAQSLAVYQQHQYQLQERAQQEQGPLGGLMRHQRYQHQLQQSDESLRVENEDLRQRLQQAEEYIIVAAAEQQRAASPLPPAETAAIPQAATAAAAVAGSPISPALAAFLGPAWYDQLRADLEVCHTRFQFSQAPCQRLPIALASLMLVCFGLVPGARRGDRGGLQRAGQGGHRRAGGQAEEGPGQEVPQAPRGRGQR